MEQETQTQQPNSLPPENKNKINPSLVFGVIAAAFILGIGAYLFVSKSPDTPSSSPPPRHFQHSRQIRRHLLILKTILFLT